MSAHIKNTRTTRTPCIAPCMCFPLWLSKIHLEISKKGLDSEILSSHISSQRVHLLFHMQRAKKLFRLHSHTHSKKRIHSGIIPRAYPIVPSKCKRNILESHSNVKFNNHICSQKTRLSNNAPFFETRMWTPVPLCGWFCALLRGHPWWARAFALSLKSPQISPAAALESMGYRGQKCLHTCKRYFLVFPYETFFASECYAVGDTDRFI